MKECRKYRVTAVQHVPVFIEIDATSPESALDFAKTCTTPSNWRPRELRVDVPVDTSQIELRNLAETEGFQSMEARKAAMLSS